MKLIFTAEGETLESKLDPRFGRCSTFLIVETEDRSFTARENPAIGAAGGAGPQAAQFIGELGAEAIISGGYGPNAFRALSAAGIRMFKADAAPIGDLLDAFAAGELVEVKQATGPSHRGMR